MAIGSVDALGSGDVLPRREFGVAVTCAYDWAGSGLGWTGKGKGKKQAEESAEHWEKRPMSGRGKENGRDDKRVRGRQASRSSIQ